MRKKTKTTWYILIIFILLAVVIVSFAGCKPPKDDEKTNGIINALSFSEKKAALENDSNSTYYGIGRTINVITDEYVEVSGLYTKIFDVESLASLNWNRTYQGKMESYSAIGSSMKQFYTNISADFNKSISAGADLGVFSASVERQFGFFAGASYEKTSNEIFYTTAQLFSTNLVEIDERANLSQFTSVLSDSFLSDISKLEDGTIDAKTIIEKYGTHSILAGYYGGRIESNYYLRNTGTVWEANVETKYKNGIKASFDKLASAGTNIEFSIKAEVLDKSEETTEHFNAYGIGGANFSALTQADFMNHYKDWVDSMNDLSLEKSVIVALPQRSLVAIWDLLPINYLKAKEKLSEATAPPMKTITVGTGDAERKLGGETVLFRHEKTLVSRPLALPRGLSSEQKAIVNYDGFGLRVIYDYNSQYKKDVISIDMLCGVKTLNPELACRLLG